MIRWQGSSGLTETGVMSGVTVRYVCLYSEYLLGTTEVLKIGDPKKHKKMRL